MIGKQVDHYIIIEKLGEGGFGSVWKARSNKDNYIYAIKMLNPDLLEKDEIVKIFFREAMILASLKHENITQLIEFFPEDKDNKINYAIVMEYIEGYTLSFFMKQYVNQNDKPVPIPFNIAVTISYQVLSALQYALDNGILHRDIKPTNIMFTPEQKSKIMDFGIATMTRYVTEYTAAKMLSIHYSAPERFRKEKIDERADIYSLGIVMFEMFTGRRPYDSDNTERVMHFHLEEKPPLPSKHNPRIPKDIEKLILKSMQKKPEHRFNNFAEMQQVFEKYYKPDGKPPEPETPSKIKHYLICAIVFLCLIIGGVLIMNFTPSEECITKNTKGYCEEKFGFSSTMILIPEGSFTMGSSAFTSEKPEQTIRMDSYYIDKYPVTNQLFDKFVQEINYITEPEKNNMGRVRHGSRWEKMNGVSWRNPDGLKDNPGDILPVTQITWNDAKAYCQWAGKQLPTEAQWEKAARGPKGASYPWGEKEPDDSVANYNSYNDGITEVNMFDKGQSYYGVYDMAGNTLEWCRDGYTVYNNKKRASHNHFEKSDKKYRVVKGSAYSEGPSSLRASRRLQYKPDYSNNVLGFRCVKEK